MIKQEDLEYLSTKVTPEMYKVFGQMAKDRGLTLREMLKVVVLAWLLAEAHAGHMADTPEAVAFMLRHDVKGEV